MTTVRPATSADADAIGRIQVETWTAAYAGLLPQETIDAFDVSARQAMWREGLGALRGREARRSWRSSRTRSSASRPSAPSYSEDGTGELYAIYVDPSNWGHGAGRALIERAEASLRESGFPKALLWVLEGNERAERFYRAAGWEHDGEKEDDFQGAIVTELRYRKRL